MFFNIGNERADGSSVIFLCPFRQFSAFAVSLMLGISIMESSSDIYNFHISRLAHFKKACPIIGPKLGW